MADTYEIEIKSLLGEKQHADKLLQTLQETLPSMAFLNYSKQLNHYFINGDFAALLQKIKNYISPEKYESLERMINEGTNHSVRTRGTDDAVILVIKASLDDATSSNGVSRMEWESTVPELDLDGLDNLLLECGFTYQAKWSRERNEYTADDMHICFDKNAGYGYLVEFEKVINDRAQADAAKQELLSFMQSVGAAELPQDRLERMFAHYNTNWRDYYGTDKTFVIE
jgi:predicted adenylyl cyclase CyaB